MKTSKDCILILLLSAGILYSGKSFSQTGFNLGLKGGATFSSLKGSDANDIKRRTGWVGGAFAMLTFAQAFAIQPEFLIQQKGASVTSANNRNKIKLNYFQIPVLFKFRLPIAGTVYPNVFAGPSFAFKMNGTYTSTNTQDGVKKDIDVSHIRKTDTGGIIGAGIDFELNHLFLSIDGRYGFGFKSLGNHSYYLNVKNRCFTLLAGVGFHIGSK